MKIVHHFIQLLAMALAIFILYHIKVDVILPYILPVTVIGVVGILAFAFITFKRRGWMVILIAAICTLLMTQPTMAAFQKFDCGGQHNGRSALDALADGNLIEAATQKAQEVLTNGNVFTDDFSNDNIKACVLLNIISIGEELCGQNTDDCRADDATYDPQMRQNAYYAYENYMHISADTAGDDIDEHQWIQDGVYSYDNYEMHKKFREIREKEYDADDVFGCIEDYMDYCACVDKKNEANCRTIAETVAKNSQDCWICSIVEAMLLASQKIAKVAYDLIADFSFGLLGVMFLFWIAFKVLQLIGTFGYGDHNSFFTEFLFRTIAVMISAAILHAPITDLYRIVISPFVMATAGFVEEINKSVLSNERGTFYDTVKAALNTPELSQDDARKNCMLHCKNMLDDNFTYDERQQKLMSGQVGGDGAFIDPQSFSALLCLTCRTYNQMVPFTAIGETMTCYAFSVKGTTIPLIDFLIPNLAYWLMGVGFVIVFSFLMTVVAFYILDIVLKLAFVIILTPFFVVAWAFPISREYTQKAWNMILYSLFEFIGVALMVAILMVLMMHALGDLPLENGDIRTAIVSAMQDNEVEKLYYLFGGAGPWTLLKLMVVCLMGYKMITASGQVVSAISDIAPGIPGVAMAALAGIAKNAMQLAGVSTAAAGMTASKVTKKAASKIGSVAKSRNASSKGSFAGKGGPTNTRQKAAEKINAFSSKSRQAGSTVGSVGEKLSNRGEAVSEKGREMAANSGIGGKVMGNLMRGGGAIQYGLGKAINPIAKGIGKVMNKAGQGVASVVDKTGVANGLQKWGDKAQSKKEASLMANPNDAARRNRGYNRISEGAAAINQSILNVPKGALLMASGMASIARSKLTRGVKNVFKRNGNRGD